GAAGWALQVPELDYQNRGVRGAHRGGSRYHALPSHDVLRYHYRALIEDRRSEPTNQHSPKADDRKRERDRCDPILHRWPQRVLWFVLHGSVWCVRRTCRVGG